MTQKKHGKMRTIDVVICGLFAALIAVGAFIRITIPTQPYPLPFSLQWLFVLLAGMLLGAKRGALTANASGYIAVEVAVQEGYSKVKDSAAITAGGDIDISSAANLKGEASATSAKAEVAEGEGVAGAGAVDTHRAVEAAGGLARGVEAGDGFLALIADLGVFVDELAGGFHRDALAQREKLCMERAVCRVRIGVDTRILFKPPGQIAVDIRLPAETGGDFDNAAPRGAESVGTRTLEQILRQQQLELPGFHLDAGTAVLPHMALREGCRADERERGSGDGDSTDQLFVHRIVPFHGQ